MNNLREAPGFSRKRSNGEVVENNFSAVKPQFFCTKFGKQVMLMTKSTQSKVCAVLKRESRTVEGIKGVEENEVPVNKSIIEVEHV